MKFFVKSRKVKKIDKEFHKIYLEISFFGK